MTGEAGKVPSSRDTSEPAAPSVGIVTFLPGGTIYPAEIRGSRLPRRTLGARLGELWLVDGVIGPVRL